MYAFGGNTSKFAGSSKRFSMVEQNMVHISTEEVSPKFCEQNLEEYNGLCQQITHSARHSSPGYQRSVNSSVIIHSRLNLFY